MCMYMCSVNIVHGANLSVTSLSKDRQSGAKVNGQLQVVQSKQLFDFTRLFILAVSNRKLIEASVELMI